VSFVGSVKRSFGSMFSYISESWAELKKVRWPSRKELTSYTVVVLFTIIVITFYFWVLDIGISSLVEAII